MTNMTDMSEQEAVRIVAEFDDGCPHDWYPKSCSSVYRCQRCGRIINIYDPPDRDALIECAKKLDMPSSQVFARKVEVGARPEMCGRPCLRDWSLITCPASTLLMALAQTIKEGKV